MHRESFYDYINEVSKLASLSPMHHIKIDCTLDTEKNIAVMSVMFGDGRKPTEVHFNSRNLHDLRQMYLQSTAIAYVDRDNELDWSANRNTAGSDMFFRLKFRDREILLFKGINKDNWTREMAQKDIQIVKELIMRNMG